MAEGEDQQFSDVTAGSEPVFDFYCELCREESKMIEAEGYCVDCEEYLCSTCFTHHRRTRYSRQHVLLDKDKMPKDTPLTSDRVNKDISKTCENHAGKPIEYYCKSHDFLGCSMCFIEGHRNCNDIEHIIKEADAIIESQEYKDFLQMLDQFDQRASDNIKLVKENLTKSKTCCTEVSKSLQKFREEINSILDELEKKLVKQTEAIQKTEENKLMDISTKVTATLESVEKIKGELSQLQISRKACGIYIKLKESKREAKQIQSILSDTEKENIARLYVFDPNSKLKETLSNLNELGNILFQDSATASAASRTVESRAKRHMDEAMTGTTPAKRVTTPSIPIILPHCNTFNTNATHVADIHVRPDIEKHLCTITGSAVMSYRRLIIVDCSNFKIKLIDTESNQLISELKVASNPWDVTKISKRKVAITLPASRKIQLLSLSDKLNLHREINVDSKCCGVVYSQNRLLVSYAVPPKLEIMDLYGQVMRKVQLNSNGNALFESPQYVCVSNNDETIYVSDCKGHKVTSLTFDGELKAVYRDKDLECPRKACVDHNDNVYVCDYFSKNVHMLTADLTKIQIILTQTHGLCNKICSVCHCQETNRLYIGMWNNNKVKVFQLSQMINPTSQHSQGDRMALG